MVNSGIGSTHAGAKPVRTILSILGVCAALVMCAVSGAMNYLFLSSLGKTPLEGQVLGAASAAADLLKSLLPFFIAWAWAARRIVAALSGTIALVFFAAFSFLSAIGFAADNRGVLVETRESVTATYDRMQRDLKDADARRAALPAHRPASVVAQDIEGHKQNRRWSATRDCQNATEVESRLFCERYFALRSELAAGQEAQLLAEMIAALQSETTKLREAGAGLERDPQVSLLSRIFAQEQDKVRLALIIVVALLVEIGSSLGLFLATGHGARATPEVRADNAEPDGPRPVGSVEDFCLEALAPDRDGALTLQELFAAYSVWCAERGYAGLELEEFGPAFASLSEAVKLGQHKGKYRGIALAA